MKIKTNKKIIEIKDLKTCNQFEKFLGLMFTKKTKAKILLFNFKKPIRISIHSFFVFFPFIAVWLDDKNNILEKRMIKSWNPLIFPKRKFSKLIEIPINKRYEKIVELLVGN